MMSNSKNILTTTDSNFDADVLKSGSLTLVDFWAEWCGPCKALAPTLDELADEFEGKIKIYKMNVDENGQTPVKYNVRGIPTCILFKNGQVVDMLTGKYPKEAYTEMFQKHQ